MYALNTDDDSDDDTNTHADHTITVPVEIEKANSSHTRLSLPSISSVYSPTSLEDVQKNKSKHHFKILARGSQKLKKSISRKAGNQNKSWILKAGGEGEIRNYKGVERVDDITISEHGEAKDEEKEGSLKRARIITQRRRFSTAACDMDDDEDVENTTIFFLHGVGGSSRIWTSQIRCLRQHGYKIVAFDFLGHGKSTCIFSASAYHFEELKEDVLRVFDLYSTSQNVIIAHSYGCSFAVVLSRQRESKIIGLILMSCGSPDSLQPDPGPFRLPLCLLSSLRCIINWKFTKHSFKVGPSTRDKHISFGAGSNVVKWMLQGQEWNEGGLLYHNAVTISSLLVYGSADGLVTLHEMQQMRSTIPHARLVIIDQASHMIMIEQPEQVNQAIVDFVRCSTLKPPSLHSSILQQNELMSHHPNMNVLVL